MKYIRDIIKMQLKKEDRKQIAHQLGVSTALISVWLNKDNDFCPRLDLARKIYKLYGEQTFPYALEALRDEADT